MSSSSQSYHTALLALSGNPTLIDTRKKVISDIDDGELQNIAIMVVAKRPSRGVLEAAILSIYDDLAEQSGELANTTSESTHQAGEARASPRMTITSKSTRSFARRGQSPRQISSSSAATRPPSQKPKRRSVDFEPGPSPQKRRQTIRNAYHTSEDSEVTGNDDAEKHNADQQKTVGRSTRLSSSTDTIEEAADQKIKEESIHSVIEISESEDGVFDENAEADNVGEDPKAAETIVASSGKKYHIRAIPDLDLMVNLPALSGERRRWVHAPPDLFKEVEDHTTDQYLLHRWRKHEYSRMLHEAEKYEGRCVNVHIRTKGRSRECRYEQSGEDHNTACDECIKKKCFCIRFIKVGGSLKRGLYPLPKDHRGDALWRNPAYWVVSS